MTHQILRKNCQNIIVDFYILNTCFQNLTVNFSFFLQKASSVGNFLFLAIYIGNTIYLQTQKNFKLSQMGTLMLLKNFTLLFLLISASLLSPSFAGGSSDMFFVLPRKKKKTCVSKFKTLNNNDFVEFRLTFTWKLSS